MAQRRCATFSLVPPLPLAMMVQPRVAAARHVLPRFGVVAVAVAAAGQWRSAIALPPLEQRRGTLTFRAATTGQGDQRRGALCPLAWPPPPLTLMSRSGAPHLFFAIVTGQGFLEAVAAAHPAGTAPLCPPPSCTSHSRRCFCTWPRCEAARPLVFEGLQRRWPVAISGARFLLLCRCRRSPVAQRRGASSPLWGCRCL